MKFYQIDNYLDQFIIETKPVQKPKQLLKFELNKIKSILDDLIFQGW